MNRGRRIGPLGSVWRWAKAADMLSQFAREALGMETILDVGCGTTSPVPSLAPTARHLVGVDILDRQATGYHEFVPLDLRRLRERFTPRSFALVVALDVIEHLPKEDGWALLRDMEDLASRKVIVSTPNGFLPQEPYDDNPYQAHVSGWSLGEFRSAGYRVLGANGWKPLRVERGELRWRPRLPWRYVSSATQLIVLHRPRFAFQLLCVKDIDADPYPLTPTD
jgi:hypothetical protein